jgi:adenine-specific DNA-methyltransferase
MAIAYKEYLEALLKKDESLIDEQGEIMGNVVKNHARNLDSRLIEILLDDDRSRDLFFFKVKNAFVFESNKLVEFLEQNQIDNSFTKYANRIGLSLDGKFLKDNTDVVLNFPYKDCILEGGQSTEEGMDTFYEYDEKVTKTEEKKGYKAGQYNEKQAKRKEIFFNEIIAKDEIDRLREPKAFENILKYDKDGEHVPIGFTRNADLNKKRGLPDDTITDNLIIKGNNLLALYSLEKEFKGKVKLIYIDPPYNTGSDSFAYNDNFNHSSWLTFMKNRLEIARELLQEDGVIMVQCDDNEQASLKLILDEIFKSKNFVETFVWKNTDNAPTLSKKTRKNIEFIHCYEKTMNTSISYVGRFSDNEDAPLLNSGNPITILKFKPGIIKFRIADGIYKQQEFRKVELLDDLVIDEGVNKNEIRLKGRFKWQQSFTNTEVDNGTHFLIKSNKFSIRYQRETASNIAPDKFINETYLSKSIGVETNEDSKKHVDSLGLDFDSYPKPETLIGFFIRAVTCENDIVMDFHLGSGTTAATAHKMKRYYIGVEQMEYIETVSKERLIKVIKGENGGISQSANWQGGGSFIYLELAKNNQAAKDLINSSTSYDALLEQFDSLYNTYFFHYNVKIKEFKENISKEENFKALTLDRQKEMFCRMLDNNQLYVNRSEMEDARFKLGDNDIRLTKDFYQIKA